jgi:hypothetical protein
MHASTWLLLLYVVLSGAVGGLINALMTDNGFLLPRKEKVDTGASIFRPGYLGNLLIGAVGAAISWGLYGPLANYVIAGTAEALATNTNLDTIGLSLSSMVGAALVGIGGARWLTNEVDKSLLRAAASKAAGGQPTNEASRQIALASPVDALRIASAMAR